MAKILYGVQSYGMGHALRSIPVIEYLENQGHKVKILTSGKAFDLLSKKFKDVEKIHGVGLVYKKNKISYVLTLLKSVKEAYPIVKEGLYRASQIMRKFSPDIVITDFEEFTARTAVFNKIPLISIDNIRMIAECKCPVNIHNVLEYASSEVGIRIIVPKASHYFVTSFFTLGSKGRKKNKKTATFVPPILRDSIIDAKKQSMKKDHILVYQSLSSNKTILPLLKQHKKEKFICYGYDKNESIENIEFKKFSDLGFVNDLAASKAVIMNGSFTLLSEAIYLGKPVLANPLKRHYEQYLNSYMLQKKGYGMIAEDLTEQSIRRFLFNIEIYKKRLKTYKQEGNRLFFKKLSKKIKELA